MSELVQSSAWEALRGRRPVGDGSLEAMTIEGAPVGSLVAIDERGELHLLLAAEPEEPGTAFPDLQGLAVRFRQLSDGANYVDVIAQPRHQQVFTPLCNEILRALVAERRSATKVVMATLRAWQSAWKAKTPSLEKAVQVGLFGELLTLQRLMIPALGAIAVRHWSGPHAERHDFVGPLAHVEVKTTRRQGHVHEISRIDQLELPEGRLLHVVSILVEESIAGPRSVATEVDRVVDALRSEPAAVDEFMAKLVRIGWTEELRRNGDLVRFGADDHMMMFSVDESFPRFPANVALPTGIVALRYTIDLANVPSLDHDEALQAVRFGFSEP